MTGATGPSKGIDYLNFIYHSVKFMLDNDTVISYSSSSASGGTPQKLRDLIPGVIIEPAMLARARQEVMEGTVPYCIFFHRSVRETSDVMYGGAYEQEILWEIHAFPGSGGLRKRNVMEGWLRTLLANKIMPVYEFLYNAATGQVTKSTEKIGWMAIFDVRSRDLASVTYVEGEEAHSVINFMGVMRKQLVGSY